MGKTSIAVTNFVRNKRRFADIFNGYCFGGETIVRPEDLEEASEQYMQEQGDEDIPDATERFRDVKMRLKNGATLRILAIENQDYVDYGMPFRCMEYDCLEYGRQVQERKDKNRHQKLLKGSNEWLSGIRKEDRLNPVYTVCLYHGVDAWDGPRTLREMMDFGEDSDGMSELFEDYPMRLFCVNEQEKFDMFHTELGEVFAALNCRRDKNGMLKLMEENEAYRHLDRDSVRVLSVLLKQPEIWEERAKYMNKNGDAEEYDMCLAWREIREDARGEGRAEGRAEGIALVLSVINMLRDDSTLSNETVAEKCNSTIEEVDSIRIAYGI